MTICLITTAKSRRWKSLLPMMVRVWPHAVLGPVVTTILVITVLIFVLVLLIMVIVPAPRVIMLGIFRPAKDNHDDKNNSDPDAQTSFSHNYCPHKIYPSLPYS